MKKEQLNEKQRNFLNQVDLNPKGLEEALNLAKDLTDLATGLIVLGSPKAEVLRLFGSPYPDLSILKRIIREEEANV